jgi:cytochrome c5
VAIIAPLFAGIVPLESPDEVYPVSIRLLAVAALLFSSVSLAAPGQLGAEDSLSPAAVQARIKPVGGVCVQGEDCKPAGLAFTPVVGAASGPRTGEQVYNAVCVACHSSGAAGAPKVGDKAAWAPRIAQGEQTLISNAINGIRGMPAKGGCASCSDEEIGNAVTWMASNSK